MKNKFINTLCLCALAIVINSCFASHTAITKRKLDVKIRMSESIFLDPLSSDKQVAYVKIRNTSGDESLNLDSKIKLALLNKGIEITDDPDEAYYILQANVLRSGINKNKDALATSFGDAIIPGVLGGVIGKQTNGNVGAAIGAAAGVGAGFLGSTLIKDVTYSIVTDIQLSQRKSLNKENSDLEKYTTRLVSYANKVNLDYKDAQPQLVDALVNSLSGML